MNYLSLPSLFLLVAATLAHLSTPSAPQRKSAAEIEATLRDIRLPEGFSISLYALAPGARTIAVGPQGKAIFVGTGPDNRVYVLTPGADRAASVELLAPGLSFDLPHGLCFGKDGALYVVERNRIRSFPNAETNWRRPRIATVVEKGALIPTSEESDGHTLRVCRIGPDDRLYVSLGQPHDVAPREKLELYDRTGIGGLIRMNLDGSGREAFARGVRNSVGMDFNPSDGSLWFTDNQTNELGDDTPPGELNRAPVAGLHFGFPWYGGGHARTSEYADDEPPAGFAFPEVEEPAHAADLGMIFYRGRTFPQKYRGGVFSAQHGSGARKDPVGARIIFTRPGPDGRGGTSEAFAEGWNRGVMPYLGRPVDVAETLDGALLVTDDENGAVYRISYRPSPIAGR
jgi:glucose/arabinose dehydrogenase